ncbi:hypothetical protein LMJ43_36915, partial [Streptomyces rochei]|nr:hypothetical protein [Streptomyces rochei]
MLFEARTGERRAFRQRCQLFLWPVRGRSMLAPNIRRKHMPAAYFVVRATVTDPAKRAAFDKWYETE